MNKQGLLFETSPGAVGQYGQSIVPDDQPLARSSDPVSSQVAAAEIAPKLGMYHHIFLMTLNRIGLGTAQEVAASAFAIKHFDGPITVSATMKKRETVRKRASALVEAGMIKMIAGRTCRETGKLAGEYQITDKGRDWLNETGNN